MRTDELVIGSLFTGIGGFDLAAERAGFEVAWQVEIDKDANAVSAQRWPDMTRLTDIREAGRHNLTPVDGIVAGFPCQDLSTAGKRRGLAGERSGLFWEMLRIVDELKPSFVLWENVPGLLSSCSCRECGRRCRDCGTLAGADDTECSVCGCAKLRGRVLREHRGADLFTIVSALGFVGLDGAWTLLDAQWFGVPQRRQRLFGVFTQRHLGAECGIEVLSFASRLSGHPPPSREAGQGVAASLRADSATGRGVNRPGRRGEDDRNIVAGTLTGGGDRRGWSVSAESAADGQRVVHQRGEGVVNALTADDVGTCGADDNQAQAGHLVFGTSGQSAWRSGQVTLSASDDNGSNAVCIPGDATHALTSEGADASEDGAGRGTPLVVNLRGRDGGATAELGGEQSTALRASQGGGDKTHVFIPFDTTQVTSDKNYSQPREGDTDHPLAAGAHPPAIAFAENQRGEVRTSEVHPQLTAGGGKPGQGYPAIAFTERTRADGRNFESQEELMYALTNPGSGGRTNSRSVAGQFGVRRLTPLECSRLQGFPDGWVDGVSDSAAYRLLGNSVAVPCVEWILRRLHEAMQ